MSVPTENETWLIEAGDDVIHKKARDGASSLSAKERLIYCFWVADYGMRNAGDLQTAHDVYADFQTEAVRLARDLSLAETHAAFALREADLQREYFQRFEKICDEIRHTPNT